MFVEHQIIVENENTGERNVCRISDYCRKKNIRDT